MPGWNRLLAISLARNSGIAEPQRSSLGRDALRVLVRHHVAVVGPPNVLTRVIVEENVVIAPDTPIGTADADRRHFV